MPSFTWWIDESSIMGCGDPADEALGRACARAHAQGALEQLSLQFFLRYTGTGPSHLSLERSILQVQRVGE
jgi:hypothetical protein